MLELWERTRTFFGRLPWGTRIGWAAAILAIIGVTAGVGIWSSQPEFIPLASDLSPGDAASIVSKLDTANISHKLNFSGSTVLVPKHMWSQARLSIGDTGNQSTTGPDWTDSVLGDPSLNRFKMLRYLETSLANTITHMSGVGGATVHIAQPDPSPFISEQEATTASIVVELKPGTSLSREQTSAIVALVSGSVKGLAADGVSVMDSRGRVLSSPTSEIQADVSGQFEYRRLLEADLATKANLMLAQMLGEGRAIVRVTADVDFTRTQRTETVYDPNLKVRKKESTKNSLKTGGQQAKTPGAGTSSNIGDGVNSAGSSTSGPFKETQEENETEYDTASTIDTVIVAPGKLRRLTVAVMADLAAITAPADDKANGATPKEPVSKENIQAIVKQAVGFDEERGDQIEVLVTELAGQQQEDQEFLTLQQWDFYRQLARSSSLGLASVVALILGMITLRRMRPILVPATQAPPQEDRERRRSQTISELSQRMRDNPDMAKAILSAWVSDGSSESPRIERRKRAA